MKYLTLLVLICACGKDSSSGQPFIRQSCETSDGITFEGNADYSWTLLTDNAAYAPRDGAMPIVHGGAMFMLGGWNPYDRGHFPRITVNEVWRSENGTDWLNVKANSFIGSGFDPTVDWEGRHTFGAVSYNGYMWILGGDPIQGHHQNDVWRSLDGATWELVNANAPFGPRALHSVFVFGGKIYVVGGQTMPKFAVFETIAEKYYNDVWTTTDGITWDKLPTDDSMFSGRATIGSVLEFQGKIWSVGGFRYEQKPGQAREYYSDVMNSDDGITWNKVSEAADLLSYRDVIQFDDRLWNIGGNAPGVGNLSTVKFSSDGITWDEICSPIAPTHASTVYNFSGKLYVAAGNHLTKEVWTLERKSL